MPLAMSSPSRAGVAISLDLSPSSEAWLPPGAYLNGEWVNVEVFARQFGYEHDVPIHYLSFDTLNTSQALFLITPPTGKGVEFWEFAGGCSTDCYSIDDDLADIPQGYLSLRWKLDPSLSTPSPVVLPGNGLPIHLGTLLLALPFQSGSYVIDLVNADRRVGTGAEFQFWPAGSDTPIVWTAANGEITGGFAQIAVGVPEPSVLLVLLIGTGLARIARKLRISPSGAIRAVKPPCSN